MSVTAQPLEPTRPRRRGWIGIVISMLSIGACVWWASKQSAPELPASASRLALAGLAIVAYATSTLIRGRRWDLILRRAGVAHEPLDAYGLTVVGYMGNTVLPARGGELLRIFLLSSRGGARKTEVLGSIIPERLLDTAAVVVLFATLTFIGIGGASTGDTPAVLALVAIVGLAAAATIYLRLRIAGRLQRFADRVRPVTRASRLLLTRAGVLLAALSVAIWTSDTVAFWLVTQSLDVSITFPEAMFVVVLGALAVIIPAGPGFAGTYDGALLFALHAVDVTGGSALGCVLLYRFIVFVPITIAGLVLMVVRYGGIQRLRMSS